jgi:long-chain acyl-CoA synthetase
MEPSNPRTLVELLGNVAAARPDAEVLSFNQDKNWTGLSASNLLERVRNVTVGLYDLGIRKGDLIAILAESGPLWTISDYAILSSGAVNVPIYPTQSIQQVEYILQEARPRLFFISSPGQARRIAGVLKRFPDLPIVSFQPISGLERAIPFRTLEERGKAIALVQPGLYEQLSSEVGPSDLASIIYTSGTTGEPKGAMLTHSNIVFNAIASGSYLKIEPDNVMLSFLPLSHIFERMVLYLCLHFGVKITYAGGLETVAPDLRQVQPTLMSTVPRMLEKIYGRVLKNASVGSRLRQKVFARSLAIARRSAEYLTERKPLPLGLMLQRKVADRLVFTKLREAVGGRMKRLVSGGAALPVEIAVVFNGAGISVIQGYGLTETSPVIAVNTLEHHRIGTVGRPLPGIEVKIADDGEILTRGPHVFKGYFNKPEETFQAFTNGGPGPQSWFKTGDIGHLDKDGFLVITDRKKDLIKTSSGKYVAPQLIESRLGQSEFVEQAIILGNDRKYIASLIVPDFERLREWAKENGIEAGTREELTAQPRVVEMFKSEVARLTKDLADYERVKRIALVPGDFTIDGGELTPTLKVRRAVIERKYADLIESLYPAGSD